MEPLAATGMSATIGVIAVVVAVAALLLRRARGRGDDDT